MVLQLEREQQRIAEQLEDWRKVRDSLERIEKVTSEIPAASSKPIGATEAIRIILRNHPDGLPAVEIREELRKNGIHCGSERNFMSNIHAIVRRQKDMEPTHKGGRTVFRLKK